MIIPTKPSRLVRCLWIGTFVYLLSLHTVSAKEPIASEKLIVNDILTDRHESTQLGQKAHPVKPTTFVADTTPKTNYTAYIGTYKMTGLPIDVLAISFTDGKLIVAAEGQDNSELKALNKPDTFDADGKATIVFIRDASGNVMGLKLEAMGTSFDGKKQ